MSEPTQNGQIIEAQSLDDLGEIIVGVDIPRPDGHKISVKMRALSAETAWAIRKSIAWPKPPIIDFQKVDGEALPIYNYQDEGYRLAQREADNKLSRCMIAASLVMDIPGETLDDKAAALEKKLGQWAYAYLIGIINRINIIDEAAIDNAARSFRAA